MKSQIRNLSYSLLALACFIPAAAQVYIPAYGAVTAQCSQANILASLTEFQNLGVKYRGTTSQSNTLTWLRNKYLSYGYTANQITEDPFTYSGSTCKNLIVTKIGTTYPNTFVIVDAHYDTVTGTGTNDNGSGVAVLLEIARLLRNVPTEYSIKFINFSGEEDGLVGSSHYVDEVVNGTTPKMDIRLVLNIDQVGGIAGETNDTLTCERDTGNPTANNAASNVMTNQLINCVELYSELNTNLSYAYASDYMPFENNGEIITGIFETNESPYPHTNQDVLAHMDPAYVYQVAQAATGATLHFAVACTSCNLGVNTAAGLNVTAFPNPATGKLYINMGDFVTEQYTYQLVNILGKTILEKTVNQPVQLETLDVSGLDKGMYLLVIDADNKRSTKKIIVN